ncbi:MAG: Slp family lipoprotein [Nitrospirota bacterium]
MKNSTLLFALFFSLQACSYAISPAARDKADQTISFEMLRSDPDLYTGKMVILGGTIAETTELQLGTLIQVMQKQLDYWGKPTRTNRTGGPFLVYYPGYLNALAYAPGREITVAGEIAGTQLKLSKELSKSYQHPVLVSKELKLWERTRSRNDPQSWDPLQGPVRIPVQQQY